jgi:hypothetical protein
MPDDLRTSLVVGARLLAGWGCAAVGVLDLSMGIDTGVGPTDGPYLLFHVVVLAGGLLLLGLGRLPRSPSPIAYGVTAALAVLASVVAALPSTRNVCCLRGFAVRHGFPLTLLAWDSGRSRHFAAAPAIADLVFWFLTGMIVLTLGTQLLSRRPRAASDAAASRGAAPTGAGDRTTHAEEAAVAEVRPAPVAGDEDVGGLP